MQNRPAREQLVPLVFVILFSAAIRFAISVGFWNFFDLGPYNIPWAVGAWKSGFSMYGKIPNLDYPPLFPTLLGLVGEQVSLAQLQKDVPMLMFWMKLIPILADCLLLLLLCIASTNEKRLEIAVLWGMNGAIIVNCAFWGQADSLLLVWIFTTLWAFEKKRPEWAAVCFALGCLTKLQMGYFAPLFLMELWFSYPYKRALKATVGGLLTGIGGWFPFVLAEKDMLLPFRIYFGGFDSYPYLNLNAYNSFGIFGGNWISDQEKLFGILPFSWVSTIVLILFAIVFPFIGYWREQQGKTVVSLTRYGLLISNGIFLFTCRMHERYQLPAVMFALAVVLWDRKRGDILIFLGMAVICFCNQLFLLFSANYQHGFREWFYQSQPWFSLANIGLFGIQIALIQPFYRRLPNKRMASASTKM